MAVIGYEILATSLFCGIKGYSTQGWSLQSKVFSENSNGFTGLRKKSSNIHRPSVSALPSLEIKIDESKVIDSTGSIKIPKHAAWESVRRERWEGKLNVDGYIPQWLHGTYLRIGPGMLHIGDHKLGHIFDGYAMVVRLHVKNGGLIAGHAMVESEAYKAAKKNNKVCHREFSVLPKAENFFQSVGNLVGLFSGSLATDNANVGITRLADGRVICFTENIKGSILIDPNTLDTLGKFAYTDNLGGSIHCAHPIVLDTELITLIPDFINRGHKVVRMLTGTNERTLIGRVDCVGGPTPSWVHSFAVTDNFVIVPETPWRYRTFDNLFGADSTSLYPIKWHPESTTAFMHVISRTTGEKVASVEVPLFVSFHLINAFEEKDENGKPTAVIVDCCEHNGDATIIDKLRLQELRSLSGQDVLSDARVGRFTLPLDGSGIGKLETALPPDEHGRGMDMSSINPKYRGKPYRYAYACGAERPCNYPNTLTKIDLKGKTVKNWYEEGGVPSEPFFVGRPGAEDEDDGVVISLLSDRNGDGYAVVLDASTFQEIARAKLPYGLPYGFHGCWVPAQ